MYEANVDSLVIAFGLNVVVVNLVFSSMNLTAVGVLPSVSFELGDNTSSINFVLLGVQV